MSHSEIYTSIGLFIPDNDPIFKDIVTNITIYQQKTQPGWRFIDDYDDLPADIFYIEDFADIISVDYQLRSDDPNKRFFNYEQGLVIGHSYPQIIGGSFENLGQAINYFTSNFDHLLPKGFPINDYIALISYVVYD